MPWDPNPENMPFREVAWVMGLALLGGLASFANRVRNNTLEHHWFTEVIADSLYSLAAGFSVYFLSASWGLSAYDAAAMSILAGHFATRWLQLTQRALIKRITGLLPLPSNNEKDDT